MHVAIIILNWNGLQDTLTCGRSLLPVLEKHPQCRVYLVDNASTDNSVAALSAEFPQFLLTVNAENLGFTEGNNRAIEHALSDGAEAVLLLNNDTVVAPDFLSPLLARLVSDPTIGMVAPKIFFGEPEASASDKFDAREQIWYAGGRISYGQWHPFSHVGEGKPDGRQFDVAGETDFASGCCVLVRAEVIRQVGALDPIFGFYGEDVDWCVRARRKGWRIIYEPASLVWHKVSRSMRRGNLRPYYYAYRNAPLVARRDLGWLRSLPVQRSAIRHALRHPVEPDQSRTFLIEAARDIVTGRGGIVPNPGTSVFARTTDYLWATATRSRWWVNARLWQPATRVLSPLLPVPPTETSLPPAATAQTLLRRPLPFGVNVAGYLAAEFGVAEAARGLVHALESAGVPFALNNLSLTNKRSQDTTFDGFRDDNPYAVNLATVNADSVADLVARKGRAYFTGRYNIGNWYWELPRFPERWSSSFVPYNEIWVGSSFCAEAISRISPVPVVKITPSVMIDEARLRPGRSQFGLPEKPFAFVFYFDYESVFERKNPLGLIQAFRRAFPASTQDKASAEAILVLKTINAAACPDKAAVLHRAAEGLPVHFIDDYLSRSEMLSLFAACDSLVSLHRSEGLGLGLAEAMFLGKPVIATGYSGNLEFMNVNNSYLVGYQLAELEETYGPYEKGNVWAEPDENHAAERMRFVYENQEDAAALGRRAARDIRAHLSPAATGRQIRERLAHIAERIGVAIPPA